MKRFQKIVALLLAILWVPCTLHCQAEALGWLGSDSTCCEKGHKEKTPKADCADCATCSAIESGGYSLPQKVVIVPVSLDSFAHFEPGQLHPVRPPTTLKFPASDSAPQWLGQSWSFRCRTALAPRAPSHLA